MTRPRALVVLFDAFVDGRALRPVGVGPRERSAQFELIARSILRFRSFSHRRIDRRLHVAANDRHVAHHVHVPRVEAAGRLLRERHPVHLRELAALKSVGGDVGRVTGGAVALEVAGSELRRTGRRVPREIVPVRVGTADGRAAAAVAGDGHGAVDAGRRARADVHGVIEDVPACALVPLVDDLRGGEPVLSAAAKRIIIRAGQGTGREVLAGAVVAAIFGRGRRHGCRGTDGRRGRGGLVCAVEKYSGVKGQMQPDEGLPPHRFFCTLLADDL